MFFYDDMRIFSPNWHTICAIIIPALNSLGLGSFQTLKSGTCLPLLLTSFPKMAVGPILEWSGSVVSINLHFSMRSCVQTNKVIMVCACAEPMVPLFLK